MIFDFYLHLNFSSTHLEKYSFDKNPFYKDIDYNQRIISLEKVTTTSLYRGNIEDCYYSMDNLHLWVFGYVFSSNYYAKLIDSEVTKLNAKEVLNLYKDNCNNFFDYLKGNFNIIIYDSSLNTVLVISDKLNVLPLYYAFNNNQVIISSNTAIMLKNDWINTEIDPVAMCMQSLFDYMLGEYYFVKGIRRCENATIYSFSTDGLNKKKYWDVSQLYHKKLLSKKSSLDLIAEQLKKNVNLYANQSKRILVSLTGGFDGRANLAMLDKNLNDFKCYSYGMPGSKQISVPQEVAAITGIQYEPVYLEEDFLNNYKLNTDLASYFSNGTAPVGFCNISYAFQKLNMNADAILTGLFGSEVLRPLHNNGIQVNDKSFEIFLGTNLKNSVETVISNAVEKGFCNETEMEYCKTAMIQFFETEYFNKYSDYDQVTRFFFFIIQEGLRKYFSQEISIERTYVTTYFPYFDFDLVDLIYRTPWAGMYNGFLGKSKFKRRKGQLLYAHIIRKYKPVLGTIKFDRGYTSDDLLLPFPFNYFKLGIGVFIAKMYMKKAGGNDTFKTPAWSSDTIRLISTSTTRKFNFDHKLKIKSIESSKLDENDFLTYRHLVSLKNFFNLIDNV